MACSCALAEPSFVAGAPPELRDAAGRTRTFLGGFVNNAAILQVARVDPRAGRAINRNLFGDPLLPIKVLLGWL